ncbi:hypothetical protein Tco_1053431 [Tanacetum coccineum]
MARDWWVDPAAGEEATLVGLRLYVVAWASPALGKDAACVGLGPGEVGWAIDVGPGGVVGGAAVGMSEETETGCVGISRSSKKV